MDRRELTTLLRWRPEHGVLSVYLDLEPGDRSEAWRIELRNGLRSALDTAREGADRGARLALEETATRLADRAREGQRPKGRSRIGFLEVGGSGRERWHSLAVPTGPTTVVHAERPLLNPLLATLDHGAERGIAAVSSEQVRLLAWAFGEVEEVDRWGLEIFSRDWRERRSRGTADPARAQGVSASGRDQYGQRLEANRERFLREAGALAAEHASAAGWSEVDVFGGEQHARLFADGFGDGVSLRHIDDHNVVSEPAAAIGERLSSLLPELSRERARALAAEVRSRAEGGARGALGLEETIQALEEGRVEHLLLAANRDLRLGASGGGDGDADGELPLRERMVELALSTGAAITLLEGDAGDELAERGGAGALLRY